MLGWSQLSTYAVSCEHAPLGSTQVMAGCDHGDHHLQNSFCSLPSMASPMELSVPKDLIKTLLLFVLILLSGSTVAQYRPKDSRIARQIDDGWS